MMPRFFDTSWRRAVSVSVVYTALGVGSAELSNELPPGVLQVSIRVAFFVLAVFVFVWHVRGELVRAGEPTWTFGLFPAMATSCGAFLLAAYAVTTAWWEFSQVPRSLYAALIVWPLVLGLPAFFAAMLLGRVMARRLPRRRGCPD